MEALDLLGHHKSGFAGHFAPDGHNHRHHAQHQFKQQLQFEQTDESSNHDEQAANLANNNNSSSHGHNSRNSSSCARLAADASSSPQSAPIQQESASSRSQAFASSLLSADCILNETNKMQYSSDEQNQTTNQSDCYISSANCEPLTEEDAFIAFCADSSSVLNNDLTRRYHVNKLYQPLDTSGPGQQRLVGDREMSLVEQDDEFLLYQELKNLCDPRERNELSKMLDGDDDDDDADNRLAGCADLMGQNSLELTSIIDSIDAFEPASPLALIDSGADRADARLRQFQCSPSSSPDKPDSSGRANERSPVAMVAGASDHCLSSFESANEADCYSTTPLHMDLDVHLDDHHHHHQHDSSSFFYQTQSGALDGPQAMLLLGTPSSRPSTCEQSIFQDSQSETSSVLQTTNSSTPQPEEQSEKGAGSGLVSRRKPHVNHYRRRTANARERIRMREINQAFEKLKRVVPLELVREASEREAASERAAQVQQAAANKKATTKTSNNQSSESSPKLTKITTLRLAVSYISKLSSLLVDNPEGCSATETGTEGKKGISKVTNPRVTKEAIAKTKRRSRASVLKKPTSTSDNENKNNKRSSKAKSKTPADSPQHMKTDGKLNKNTATPPSISAFNDANGFKRIDSDDEKAFKFENGAEMKVQQPILCTDSPLFNRAAGYQQPQTAYIAMPHHQNQKQQYLTAYQPSQQQKQQQQHSMISQTRFNQNHQDRLLVAPVPVAILVSNLVYINPMRQGVRQQQFFLVNQQGQGSQQPQNGSSQAQVLTTKQVDEVTSVTEQMNNQTNNEASNCDNGQLVQVPQPSFCQTKFVATQFPIESQSFQQQHQQQQQVHQQPQIRPDESLESNINKLVASLATSPISNTADSQQHQNQVQHNLHQPATGNQQQPVRTYRFHNYDGSTKL